MAENFRPGVMDRLGVGYAALSAVNPRLIFASASMFGPRGPRTRHPGYDTIAQAAGGMVMATSPAGPATTWVPRWAAPWTRSGA